MPKHTESNLQSLNSLNADIASDLRKQAQSDPSVVLEYELLVGQLEEEVRRAEEDLKAIEQQITTLDDRLEALHTDVFIKGVANEHATNALNAVGGRNIFNRAKYDEAFALYKETGDAWQAAQENLSHLEATFDAQQAELEVSRSQLAQALAQARADLARAQQPPSWTSSLRKVMRADLSDQLDKLVIGEPGGVSQTPPSPVGVDQIFNDDASFHSGKAGGEASDTASVTDSVSRRSSDAAMTDDTRSSPRSRRDSTSSTERQSQRVLSRYEREVLADQAKITALRTQEIEWIENVSERDRLEKSSEQDIDALADLDRKQQDLTGDLKRNRDRLGNVKNIITQSEREFEARGFVGRLWSAVVDFVTRLMGGETTSDRHAKHLKLRQELEAEETRLSSAMEENDSMTKHYQERLTYHEEELRVVDQKLQGVDGAALGREIRALETKRSGDNMQKDVMREQAKKDALIERCKPDSSLGVLRKKEASDVVLIKNALRDFLQTPTETTLSSLTKVVQDHPEAYHANKEVAALLKDVSADYPEIAKFTAPKKNVEAKAHEDVSLSRSEKIASNATAIKQLEKEIALLERRQQHYTSLQTNLQEELGNLAALQDELSIVRNAHTSEDELSELLDEEELLDGIESNQERIEHVREQLSHVGDVSGKIQQLDEKLENLREVNDMLVSERNQAINKEVDGLLQRCEPEKKGMLSTMMGKKDSPQDIVKGALRTFILDPSRTNLEALSSAQKNNPVSDPVEHEKLETLVTDALMLFKKDVKGYSSAVAARKDGSQQAEQSSSLTTSFKQKLSQQLPEQDTEKAEKHVDELHVSTFKAPQ